MKCLIVRSPFAEWIVYGVKPIEYRTRKTDIRGKIGIVCKGRVIGDVELVACIYNEEYGLYEWHLKNPRQYETSISFPPKKGAIVWINVDYDSSIPKILPKKEYTYDWLTECLTYEKEFIRKYIEKRNKNDQL